MEFLGEKIRLVDCLEIETVFLVYGCILIVYF